MTVEENNVHRRYIGRIIRAARLYYGITQNELAEILNVNQSTISKIEQGYLEPGISGWHQFLEKTRIKNIECFKTGYIDIPAIDLEVHSSNNTIKIGALKLHKNYAIDKSITVRKVVPLIEYLNAQKGEKIFHEFVISKGMKPEYFYILNNPLNSVFESDLCTLVMRTTNLRNCNSLKGVSNVNFHGSIGSRYKQASKPAHLLEQFVKKQKQYLLNYDYGLGYNDIGISIEVKRNEDLTKSSLIDHTALELMDSYNFYFPFNLQLNTKKPYQIASEQYFEGRVARLELMS